MLLMTPGPVALDGQVIAAMNRPAVFPRQPEFVAVIENVAEMLRRIFLTHSNVAIVPGSGRLGLESALVSLVERGDRTLHLVNGTFGAYPVEIARRAGAETTVIEGRPGGPPELDRAREVLRTGGYRLVTVCHSETSTGAVYDVRELASLCHEYDTLIIVDAISSVGCMELRTDEWELDLVVGTANKALGSVIGLALVGVGPGALKAMDARSTPCQSYCLDLKRALCTVTGEQNRLWATVPFTHLYYALQEACRQVLEEGLEPRWARHRAFAEATRRGVEAMGLELFPDRGLEGSAVTAVRVPAGLDEASILSTMREKYGVMLAGGTGSLKGTLFRISHQGVQASREMLIPTLAALEGTLGGLGHEVEPAVSVGAFLETLKR